MGNTIMVVRQRSWLLTIPQVAILFLLIVLGYVLFKQQWGWWSLAVGLYVFLIYRFIVRWAFMGDFYRARRKLVRGEYEEALRLYEKVYEFFSKHPWLDRFRYLILLTPSKRMIRETALNNIVYCYFQLGDKAKVKSALDRFLGEFPDNIFAKSALEFIEMWEQDD